MTKCDADTVRPMDLCDRLEIDQICLLFEDRLRTTPDKWDLCRDLLGRISTTETRERALYEMIRIDLCGKSQVDIARDLDQYLQRFPEHAAVIRKAGEGIIPEELPSGYRIGRYRIDSVIDRGAFSVVYAAHGSRDERVALKLFRTFSDDADECLASFKSEVCALQRLRHPGVLPLLDFGCEIQQTGSVRTQQPFLVTPLYAYGTLKSELTAGPISVVRTVSIASVLASALASGHALGIIHGDLKPGNILISNSGDPVLADFGLSMNADLQHLRQNVVSGSLGYMAPEQMNGESQWLDGRADLWSLGVVIYEMLAGRKPLQSTSLNELVAEVQRREITPLCQFRPEVPQALNDACLKCLQPAPGDRYASAGHLLEVLQQVSKELPEAKCEGHRSLVSAIPEKTWSRRVTLGLAVALILTGVFATLVSNRVVPDSSPETLLALFRADQDDYQILVRNRDEVLSEGTVVSLQEGGEPLELDVEVEEDSYVYVISVEPRHAIVVHPDPNSTEPPIFVRSGARRKLAPLYPLHSGLMEHLLLLGSTAPIQMDSIASIITQLTTEPDTRKREYLFRGLSRTQDRRISTLIIPYRVEPPGVVSASTAPPNNSVRN